MSIFLKILLSNIPSIALLLSSHKIGKKFSLLDFPDNKRKIHNKPIPKTGGIIIYLSVLFFLILNGEIIDNYYFVIFLSFFFLLGLVDDLIDLSSNSRLILSIVFLIIFFYFDNEILINNLKIFGKDLNLTFHLPNTIIILLTILCILLLQHAINMMDGINTVCALFIMFCIIYFNEKNGYTSLDIFLLTNLFLFTIFNYKNKIFLGNAGSYLLSSFLAFKILHQNYFHYNFTGEQIFLILMIPGLDMLRLFIFRILKKQNPFQADSDHLHHLIIKYFKGRYNLSILLTLVIVFTPGLFNLFFNIENYYLIFIFIILYSIFILKIKKKLF